MLKYLADILTFSRILLSLGIIIYGCLGGSIGVGFLLFILAELTDSFDGTCSRKWPFPKGKEPKYRRYAVKYDMIADALLWFAAVLFFTLRISTLVGLIIMFGVALICLVVELIIYGRLFGHPNNCSPKSLCARNFALAKKIVMIRRWFYLFTIVFVAASMLIKADWPATVKIIALAIGIVIGLFLFIFLKERREHISRDAVDLEQKMLKKSQK